MLEAGAADVGISEGDMSAADAPLPVMPSVLDGGAGDAVEEGALLLLALDCCCCALCLSTVAFQSLTNDLA